MEDLDSIVRRVDPDRWLASRFIPDEAARADVIAIYAFDHELARAPKVASQPLIGEIRLTWWADAIAEIYEGGAVRRHPVTLALQDAIRRHGLPREPFDAMVEARFPELDGASPDRVRLAEAAMSLAVHILGAPGAPIVQAAYAWADQDSARLQQANADLRALRAQAFPGVAYATLVRRHQASPLARRLRLAWAVLRGRL